MRRKWDIYHGGNAASKPFQADVKFCGNESNGESNEIHLAPVIRSGELVGLGSVMVKGATGSRETTSACGAEV